MKINIEVTEADAPSDVMRAANALMSFAGSAPVRALEFPDRVPFGLPVSAAEPVQTVEQPEPAKRTRRTKAQIEADQAAAAEAEAEQAAHDDYVEDMSGPAEQTELPVEETSVPAAGTIKSQNDVREMANELMRKHGVDVKDVFLTWLKGTFTKPDGTPAGLSTLQEKDWPAYEAVMQRALATPQGQLPAGCKTLFG